MNTRNVSSLWRKLSYTYAIILTIFYVSYFTFVVLNNRYDEQKPTEQVNLKNETTDSSPTTENIIELMHDEWTDLGDGVQVYSAYWEQRTQVKNVPFVRVIGIAPRWLERRQHSIRCLLWYHGITEKIISNVTRVRMLNEHHNKPLSAAFFECHPPKRHNGILKPYAASIEWIRYKDSHRVGPPNPVMVRNIPKRSSPKIKGSVVACIKPMYGPYDDLRSVAEFMAFYHIMGVSHFVIYIAGVHPNILKFFNQVSTQLPNIQIDLLPWNLWMFWDEIHDNAGMASINDCVYRYMEQTEYLLVTDLDEFMVPSYVTKYIRLLPDLQQVYNKGVVNSFIFQNRFYCLERNRRSPMMKQSELNILIRVNGVKEFWWPYGLRNKYIMRPSSAIQAGYHNLWKSVKNTTSLVVPTNVGYSHHYRECRPLEQMAVHNQGKHWKLPRASYIRQSYVTQFSSLLHNSTIIQIWLGIENQVPA